MPIRRHAGYVDIIPLAEKNQTTRNIRLLSHCSATRPKLFSILIVRKTTDSVELHQYATFSLMIKWLECLNNLNLIWPLLTHLTHFDRSEYHFPMELGICAACSSFRNASSRAERSTTCALGAALCHNSSRIAVAVSITKQWRSGGQRTQKRYRYR